MSQLLDLDRRRHLHIVGLGGAGMSAIATVLAEMGHHVSGSDLKPSPVLDRLEALGVTTHVGHAAHHLGVDVEVLTRSTAVDDANPEVRAARERGLPVLRRAEALAAICERRDTVAVAGTHGKTTTASMLALALRAGGGASFIIGGELNDTGTGAAWRPDDRWFVVEADESDGTFLDLPAHLALVTNVEPDHLGSYGSFDSLVAGFGRFLAAAPVAVACADDPIAAQLATACGARTYGWSDGADYRLVDVVHDGPFVSGTVIGPGGPLGELRPAVPGAYNTLNALGALAAAVELGADPIHVRLELARFTGVARRFEDRGTIGGIGLVDDYAHLPGEVRAVLAAAKAVGRRVVCVFQPHRFTRTADLWADFEGAFDDADVLVVTDVYGAGEAPQPGVSGQLVADAAGRSPGAPPVTYVPARSEVAEVVDGLLVDGDLCVTLGAGDLTTLADELHARHRS